MTCKITVVAHVEGKGESLVRLVKSLDAQSLGYDEFETIFVVPDLAGTVGARLTGLALRRPNVRVLAASDDRSAPAREARGTWVLDLGPAVDGAKPALFADSLARIVDFGSAYSCDAVLIRTVPPTGRLVNDLFVVDRPQIDPKVIGSEGPAPLVAVRKEFAATAGPSGDLHTFDGAVGVLGRYPGVVMTPKPAPAAAGVTQVVATTLAWRAGRLSVHVEGSTDTPGEGTQVIFTLSHLGSALHFHLPASKSDVATGRFSGEVEIDVFSAADGQPLAEGVWAVQVGLHGATSRWQELAAVPRADLGAAILRGVSIALGSKDGGLTLDVGAQRTSVVGKLAPADVLIQETARGTLLTTPLEQVAVVGDSRTPGRLLLDAFALPAHIVAEGGRARIECYLSGLSGSSVLSAQFGAGGRTPTGLTLVISPTGTMTVAETPRDASKPRVQKRASAALRQAAGTRRSAAPPFVRSLRRRVPAALEPAVRRLSRSTIARRIYRAAAGHRRDVS